MREKEREGNYSNTLGRQAIGLLDSQGSSRVRTHLSGPLTSEGSNFLLWIPDPLTAPQDPQISFVLSQTPHSNFSPEKPA